MIKISDYMDSPYNTYKFSSKTYNSSIKTYDFHSQTNMEGTLTRNQQDRYLPGIQGSDLWMKKVWLRSSSCDLRFGGGGGANG